MNILELFAGSRSIGKVGDKLGMNVFSVDWEKYEDIDLCLRAAANGAKTICSQAVDSIHLSGQTRDDKTKSFEKLSHDLFLERWGGRVSPDLQ